MIALAFHDCSKDTPSSNGALYDAIIKAVTQSPLVHVEVAFIPTRGDFKAIECFSAVPEQGCRFARIDLTEKQWVVVPTKWSETLARQAANRMVGMPYDWLAILWWFLPWHPHARRERFCSQAGTDVGKFCGDIRLISAQSWHTSPAALNRMVTQ